MASSPIFEVSNLRVEREAVILHEVNWRVERGNTGHPRRQRSGKTRCSVRSRDISCPRAAKSGSARTASARALARGAQIGRPRQLQPRHKIEPDQTARAVVLSGRDAQINFWDACPPPRPSGRARPAPGQGRAPYDRAWRYSRKANASACSSAARSCPAAPPLPRRTRRRPRPVAREDFLQFLNVLAAMRHAPHSSSSSTHRGNRPALHHVLLLRDGRTLAAGPKEKNPHHRQPHRHVQAPSPCAAAARATTSTSAATPVRSRRKKGLRFFGKGAAWVIPSEVEDQFRHFFSETTELILRQAQDDRL